MSETLQVTDGQAFHVDVLDVSRRLLAGGHRAQTMVSLLELRAMATAIVDLHSVLTAAATACSTLDKLADVSSPVNFDDASKAFSFLYARLIERCYLGG